MQKLLILIIILVAPVLVQAQKADKTQLANEYYINGELEKALDIYSELAKDPKQVPVIHNNYFNILLELKEYKNADKYIKRTLKFFPSNTYYKIDRGILYNKMGKSEVAEKYFNQLIQDNKSNQYLTRTSAQYFATKQLTSYALQSYVSGRKYAKAPGAYALELANIYRILGDKTMMIEEYLLFASQRPNNLRYIKNILQNILVEEEDVLNFQNILVQKIQKQPNERMFGELLIWVNLQQKNFYGAFVQAKAIDRRFDKNGARVMDIGKIALQNKAYDPAIQVFEYIVDKYKKGNNYSIARRYIINAREGKVKNVFPMDQVALKQLTEDYQSLVDELGYNQSTGEALRSKALLHAFYLDEKDSAIAILNKIIKTPRIANYLKAQSKLDLGDIYILTGEPWESTLLYSQVEKTNKDSPTGYEAKLKNARLNYYKGEFELAKSHLDILKQATTREISNDAISLSLLIQDNTVLDTSDVAMKEFASVELLLFQNKRTEALKKFAEMHTKYPGHSLTDEIYWRMANINMELGNFDIALGQLQKIVENYPKDILGDDAYFLQAKILEEQLDQNERAMEIFNDFLLKYPGSVFTAEARKRFRQLRGDNVF